MLRFFKSKEEGEELQEEGGEHKEENHSVNVEDEVAVCEGMIGDEELRSYLHKLILGVKKPVAELRDILREELNKQNVDLGAEQQEELVEAVIHGCLGFGPIQMFMDDPTVSEIMINGPNQVYVERNGKTCLSNITFQDEFHLKSIVERMTALSGKQVTESQPMTDLRLADGSRVNIVGHPVAMDGPLVTIRKFNLKEISMEDLLGFGTLNEEMANLLDDAISARLNIIVSGGTSSGKTSTLNMLSTYIPSDERIVIVEDTSELQMQQPHVVYISSRPAGLRRDLSDVTIRDLVRNALRMRPDRLIVGEVRGGEAIDMLQAMNTGHDGSLTTGHANSPRDMFSRLETMVLMSGIDLPTRAIREQISSAVDLIVHQSRFQDGSRKITHISEVHGLEGDVLVLQDLYKFEQTEIDENGKVIGEFRSTRNPANFRRDAQSPRKKFN